ncbi:CocE/NonD family hydrolase [Streptomyces jumonjinensis]|uniref:CocE/NonD family hydrolase n=1 Tax=Streptomyces jumonjinensis TaxID=1945 RepID=UPI00378B5E12
MRHRVQFPYETHRHDTRIPVRDGTLLYARVWRPETDRPVPALLEYSPERLTDTTASRDWQRHPWYAGHGYASVRVDVRGHGNSGGLPDHPAAAGAPPGAGTPGPTTLTDAVEVIDWLAAQPWCTGRVGMFGIGWGGDCALRVAALGPEPLRAVVTVCASDDPYDNGGCYLGGSMLAEGLLSRSAARLSSDCRPPDPHDAGESWRALWLDRLEAVEPAAHTWLAHQIRDDFWERRTPGPALHAAVLAVGGWYDPHRDTVLRLLERLPADRVRGVIGPWSHQYPDHGGPGPAIGFLQETRRWWDRHLRDIDNGAMAEPLLRVWSDESHWTGEPAWPPADVTAVPYELRGASRPVDSPHSTGLDAGPYVPHGGHAPDQRPGQRLDQHPDQPLDQRLDDAYSACFEFPVNGDPVTILGSPRVTLRLRLDVPHGQVIARLCDIAPDGSSAPVTAGVLNLAARHGRERAHAWPPGGAEDVSFPLTAIAHTFPRGHRIRLAISSAYWPWVWPQPGSAGFVLVPENSRLELPVREARVRTAERIIFPEPEQSEPLGVSSPATLDGRRPERLLIRDVTAGEWRLETLPRPAGGLIHPDGLERTEEALETYTVQERDPHTARAAARWTVRLHRPDRGWDVTVETSSEISCDTADFLLRDEAVCRHGEEVVFHRTWERRLPRLTG